MCTRSAGAKIDAKNVAITVHNPEQDSASFIRRDRDRFAIKHDETSSCSGPSSLAFLSLGPRSSSYYQLPNSNPYPLYERHFHLRRIPMKASTSHFSLRYVVFQPAKVNSATYSVTEICSSPIYKDGHVYEGHGRDRNERSIWTTKTTSRVVASGRLQLKMRPQFEQLYECRTLSPLFTAVPESDRRCYVDLNIAIRLSEGLVQVEYPQLRDSCSIEDEDSYTKNCAFSANKNTCTYTNDAYESQASPPVDKDEPRVPESCDLISAMIQKVRALKITFRPSPIAKPPNLYVNPIGEEILFGMHTTPSLRRAPENAAMRFQFSFHARGVHQIVVMLLCVSRQSEVMYLRPNYRHYSLTNFVQRERNWSQAKCLDIHTYLRGSNYQCEEFRVRFVELAAGSRLVVQNL